MRKFLTLLAVMPTLAFAEVDPAEVEALDSCMKGPREQSGPRDCIGRMAQKCMELPDGYTTVAMTECAMQEAAAWDVLLNVEYKTARDFARELDAADKEIAPEYAVRADALLTAQRAWITFRDANCTSDYVSWGQASMRHIMAADCQLEMTAERTIALFRYYDKAN